MRLNDSEMQTVRHALSVAAERFRLDEADALDVARESTPPNAGMLSVAHQFRRQRVDTLIVLAKLEGEDGDAAEEVARG